MARVSLKDIKERRNNRVDSSKLDEDIAAMKRLLSEAEALRESTRRHIRAMRENLDRRAEKAH